MVLLNKISKFTGARHPWHPFYLGPRAILLFFSFVDTVDAPPATRLSLIGKQYQPDIDKLIENHRFVETHENNLGVLSVI